MKLNEFKKADLTIPSQEAIHCTILEHPYELFLIINISGVCPTGSQGKGYGDFLYEKIGLALLKYKPLAVVVDLSELHYQWGNEVVSLFEIFDHIKINEEGFITAFVLSEKNEAGLSSLIKTQEEHFFTDFDQAFAYAFAKYDLI